MRLNLELVMLSIRRALTYRVANLAGLVTNLFFGLLRVSVMTALYGAQTRVQDVPLQAAITFTGLSQALISFLWLFGWTDLMKTVDSGDVASDLLKPLDLFQLWFARELGRSLVNLVARGLPIMLVYAVIMPITAPSDLAQWLAVAVSACLAFVVSFGWRFLVNLAAFWTPNAIGVGRFAFTLSLFLSGFFMPLRFFPDWFVALCRLTPFPSMVNTVVEAFLGVLTGPALMQALAVQAAWAAGLTLACYAALRAGVRRLVIQGG